MSLFIRTISGVDPDYKKTYYLGSGVRGSAYVVKRRRDGEDAVCKQIDVTDPYAVGRVLSVIADLRSLEGCRNVVLWHDDVAFDSLRMRMHVHMDRHKSGLDLYMKLLGRTDMPKEDFTSISASLVMALKDCHDKGVCHRDIKPSNVLLSKKDFQGKEIWVGHLTDFGIAELANTGAVSPTAFEEKQWPSNIVYMAPEVIESPTGIFAPKSDVFALGSTLWHVANARFPFMSLKRDAVPAWSSHASYIYGGGLVPLINAMMTLDIAKRQSSAECEQSFKTYINARIQKKGSESSNKSLWMVLGAAVLAPHLLLAGHALAAGHAVSAGHAAVAGHAAAGHAAAGHAAAGHAAAGHAAAGHAAAGHATAGHDAAGNAAAGHAATGGHTAAAAVTDPTGGGALVGTTATGGVATTAVGHHVIGHAAHHAAAAGAAPGGTSHVSLIRHGMRALQMSEHGHTEAHQLVADHGAHHFAADHGTNQCATDHGAHQYAINSPAPADQGFAGHDDGAAAVPTPEQQATYQQALLMQQQQQAQFHGLLAAYNQSFATTSGIMQAQNASTTHNMGMMYSQGNSMALASHDARMDNLAMRTDHNQDFVNAISGINTIKYTWQGPV